MSEKTTRSFIDGVFNGNITLREADIKQKYLLESYLEFNNRVISTAKTDTSEILLYHHAPHDGKEIVLNTFKYWIFPLKFTLSNGIKILTPKQMLQRLPIALAQVITGNAPRNLLNRIG